jgi:hypothetical protein
MTSMRVTTPKCRAVIARCEQRLVAIEPQIQQGSILLEVPIAIPPTPYREACGATVDRPPILGSPGVQLLR